MSENSQETQHAANRAFEKSEDAHQAIAELKHELKRVSEELSYLRSFSNRILNILKVQFRLNDIELNGIVDQIDGAQERLEEKPGFHLAPLCPYCERPLQEDSQSCIYCGKSSR